LAFVLITTFITPIALLSNHLSIANNLKHFLISILLLETLQIALFTVLDLLLFYVFFESILPAKRSGKTLLWVKLPNSGNTLKLLIPNYS
jgi:formate hydrogenlyase subunit 3/multisubunit Na+/H+ antiporter MnhD subunit